jgi:hypothetical protein
LSPDSIRGRRHARKPATPTNQVSLFASVPVCKCPCLQVSLFASVLVCKCPWFAARPPHARPLTAHRTPSRGPPSSERIRRGCWRNLATPPVRHRTRSAPRDAPEPLFTLTKTRPGRDPGPRRPAPTDGAAKLISPMAVVSLRHSPDR